MENTMNEAIRDDSTGSNPIRTDISEMSEGSLHTAPIVGIDIYRVIASQYDRNVAALDAAGTNANVKMLTNIVGVQAEYINVLQNSPNIRIGNTWINFWDNNWDLTANQLSTSKSENYRLHFQKYRASKLPEEALISLKLFVLYNIAELGLHSTHVSTSMREIRKLYIWMKDHNKGSMTDMTIEDFDAFLGSRNITYETVAKEKTLLAEYLGWYEICYGVKVITYEVDRWLKDIDRCRIDAQIETNKRSLPPADFIFKYSQHMYANVFDTAKPKWERGYAGLCFIVLQLGLHPSDAAMIRYTDMIVIPLDDGKKIIKLHYRTRKTVRGTKVLYHYGDASGNIYIEKVIRELNDLFAEERAAIGIDELVPRHSWSGNVNGQKNAVYNSLRRYHIFECIRCRYDFGLVNVPNNCAEQYESPNLTIDNVGKDGDYHDAFVKFHVPKNESISMVSFYQMRVYVASEWHARNADGRQIGKMLAHTAPGMEYYYVRDKYSIEQQIDQSKMVLTEVVRDGTTLIGNKAEAMTEKINKFISDNNFNVATDLDTIIDGLQGEIAVNVRDTGFCLHSNPSRKCWHDSGVNQLSCAFGMCSNRFYFYFNLPITYGHAVLFKHAYDYNMANGFVQAAEREAEKLNYIVVNVMEKELNETEKELAKQGYQSIINKHPEMKDCLDRLSDIKKEATAWKNLRKTN